MNLGLDSNGGIKRKECYLATNVTMLVFVRCLPIGENKP